MARLWLCVFSATQPILTRLRWKDDAQEKELPVLRRTHIEKLDLAIQLVFSKNNAALPARRNWSMRRAARKTFFWARKRESLSRQSRPY